MTVQLDSDLIKRRGSVTAGDVLPGSITFLVPGYGYGDTAGAVLPPDLPRYGTRERQRTLHSTVQYEAMWSAAVNIAVTRMASLAWNVDAPDSPQLGKRAQEMLLNADNGRGWVSFLSRHLRAFLTTDNGAFIEIVRQTTSMGSRITGINHLPSLRCWRTGNPERPVVYYDRMGAVHELKWYQVVDLVDMPDDDDRTFGQGLCAASRAYPSIIKLAAIERYVYEKVSGNRALAIHLVSGISSKGLKDALVSADEEQAKKGAVNYKGAVVVPMLGDQAPALVTIPLSELPDGFDAKQERDIAILTYANALGLDPQELQPLTGQSLGTGAQSQVLDDKASGKGASAWRQSFTHVLNEWMLPSKVVFYFSERDYRDQQQQANIKKANVDMVMALVTGGTVTNEQAVQLLVDADVLPKSFAEHPDDAMTSLADTDKADAEQAEADMQYRAEAESLAAGSTPPAAAATSPFGGA